MKLEIVALEKLHPNETNPRIASEDTLRRLKASIEEFGFVEPIICWVNERGEYEIVAGHQRWKEAKEAGLRRVPIIVYPFKSRKAATAFNITSNRLAELSEWDYPKLKDNLEFLEDGEFNLEVTGFNFEERESLMTWVKPDFQKTREELENIEKRFLKNVGEGHVKYMILYFHFGVDDAARYEELKNHFSLAGTRECDVNRLWEAMQSVNGKPSAGGDKRPEVPADGGL